MIRKLSEFPTAEPFLPKQITMPALRKAAQGCRGCPLYQTGTQTVFGQGPESTSIMFIGEQPGDQEDRAGVPFVGPAGQILDELLSEAGIDRNEVYVTNAVKHFKWEARGKRRLHTKPNAREIAACKPWLMAELQVVTPKVVVCLGATAAQDLLGRDFRLTQHRGEVFRDTQYAPAVLATIHPSAILRMPDPDSRRSAREGLLEDLKLVKSLLKKA